MRPLRRPEQAQDAIRPAPEQGCNVSGGTGRMSSLRGSRGPAARTGVKGVEEGMLLWLEAGIR